MKNSIIVHNLDVEELKQLLRVVLKEQLEEIKEALIKDNQEELLTREETCKLLKINSSTLWHWTNKGKVKAYGIASRRYYKRSEILECLTLKR